MNTKTEIELMVGQLEQASKAYYAGDPFITDKEFDMLEDKLRKLDPLNPYFNKTRESVATGYGTKYKHIYDFIGSVDKIHTVNESKIFKSGRDFFLSAKLDGTSMVAYYKDGKLVHALTRGDGYEGFDVTQHYLAITQKYRLNIPSNFTGAVRGEVIFSLQGWEMFKSIHPEAKFPRNSGTGLVNQKTVQPEASLLDFVAYDLPGTSISSIDRCIIPTLDSWGFRTAPWESITTQEISEEYLKELFDIWATIYPLDGIVIRKCLSHSKMNEDGLTHTFDKIQEAFKFEAETKECLVTGITWALGRTGKLVPVIQIEPTELSGAVVTNITGHNAKTIQDNCIDAGAIIKVRRSGEVIPYFAGVTKKATLTTISKICPCCGQPLTWTDTGVDLICTNDDCSGKIFKTISNYILTMCSDIKGVGDVFLESFIAYFDPKGIADSLYILNTKTFHTIPTLGNADNVIAQKVIKRLTQSEVDPSKFLQGLGIKLLGESFAQELAASPKLKDVVNSMIGLSEPMNDTELENIILSILPGRKALASSIVQKRGIISDILKTMATFGQYLNLVDKSDSSQQSIRYYAVTGSLSKPRKEFEAELLTKGWKLTETISKAEFLINNDNTSNSSKNLKAKASNKPILTEEEFRSKYFN